MRVTGGKLKGRVLRAPRGRRTRPTREKVREAIFDILANIGPFSRVLDLFAGSGALGIEALSRGAKEAVFVEKSKGGLQSLRRNLEELGLKDKSHILPFDVKKALRILEREGVLFDLILLDPPYGRGLVSPTLQEIRKRRLLEEDGIIVVEHAPAEEVLPPESLSRLLSRRYSDTSVTILHKAREGSA